MALGCTAQLTTTLEGPVDASRVQCFAWYGYVRSNSSRAAVWDQAVSMRQRRVHATSRYSCQLPLRAGHVLQATAYCVADGQLVWAPEGNANFRLPDEDQHPAGAVAIRRELSSVVGLRRVPASDAVFPVHVASEFVGAEGAAVAVGSKCVARFGYPRRFGGAWPTVNETELALVQTAQRGVDHWVGTVELPAAGGLLEATARCTYNGIESWLGGNILVQAF
eukprot:m51a1_g6459 hypothetical protein (222) ;mRNA; f:19213-20107